MKPSSSSVGWGIVGTGAIAEHFATDLKHVSGAHLAAISSRSHDKAISFAARHGAAAHKGLSSLLGDESVNAIYIASPNDTHFNAAMAAITAGKGVLVEKPLVTTIEEAERLMAFAAERKVFLMEGMWTRFLPSIAFVKNVLGSGAIGDVRRIDGELAFAHPYDPVSRFFDATKGGGVLLDLGVYLVSLSLALFGRPDEVYGRWRAAPNGIDLAADIELAFSGCRARLGCAMDRNGTNLFVIEGTRGALVLQPPFIAARGVIEATRLPARLLAGPPVGSFMARTAAKLARKLPLPGVHRHRFDFPGHGLQFEIAAATNAIASGHIGTSLAPTSDTLETLRIIEQVRGSSSS